jgi:S1-C subfamily serine protease
MKVQKYLVVTIIFVLIVGLVCAAAFFGVRIGKKIFTLQGQVSNLQNQLAQISTQLVAVESESHLLSSQNVATSQIQSDQAAAISQLEIERRQAARNTSQDDLLTQAVAKVTPAVVSIVISKNVPQLQISYENPFGDDPFFKDFDIRVPVYRQNGTTKQKVGAGSGFLVSQNGYILTNKHVVTDDAASYTVLLSTGKQIAARVVYKDSDDDLAIIKIEGQNYPTVDLGDSSQLKLGQSVVAIGNALGEYNNSVSVGIISGLNRTITAGDSRGRAEQLTGVIQTDAAINPGNSGGPLIALSGKVIGINVATVMGSNSISFSIPINEIKDVIKEVVR